MNTFNLLEGRHHVSKYSDKIPPKELIEKALWKAWKTTPSKNNAMPYKVFVFGPEHKMEKVKVWKMVYDNHIDAEHRAVARGDADKTESGKPNPFYEHIKYNPYLFCIHAQPREPNEFYKKQVELGMFFDQAWPERIEKFIDTTALEVGMFAQNLSTYLLEEKIDVSYTSCFFRNAEKWRLVGLEHAEYRPIMLITCGYGEVYRKDILEKWDDEETPKGKLIDRSGEDMKPAVSEMIKWI